MEIIALFSVSLGSRPRTHPSHLHPPIKPDFHSIQAAGITILHSVSQSVMATAAATAELYLNGTTDRDGGGGGEVLERAVPVVAERQTTGASMMEQLVPEITTHALTYLDYQSLCRLSMTNTLMRRAANDDNAWKALYHKDFTLEQDNINLLMGGRHIMLLQ